MFKKKSKDSTAVNGPPAFDQGTSATFVDSTAATKPKKGGLFKKKEKKPKVEKVKQPKPEKDKKKEEEKDPKKKKEEEDDGF